MELGKIYRVSIFAFILFILSSSVYGNTRIDSLESIIEKASVTEKIDAYIYLSREYWETDTDLSLANAEIALSLSEQIEDIEREAQSYLAIGIAYEMKSMYDKALSFYGIAREISEKNGYKLHVAQADMYCGYVYQLLNDNDKSIESLNRSISLFQAIGNDYYLSSAKDFLADTYMNMGRRDKVIEIYDELIELHKNNNDSLSLAHVYVRFGVFYMDLSMHEKSLNYLTKAMELYVKTSNEMGIAICLNNIAIVYDELDDSENAVKYFEDYLKLAERIGSKEDIALAYNNLASIYEYQEHVKKALEYLEKSGSIYKEIDNVRGVALTDFNIGTIHYRKYQDYPTAIEYISKALSKLKGRNFENQNLERQIYYVMSQIKTDQKQYSEAKKYLEKCEQLIEELGLDSQLESVYLQYSEIFTQAKDYKKALDYLNNAKTISDSLNIESNKEEIAKLRVIFETHKAEKENEILKKNNEIQQLSLSKRKHVNNFFSILIIVVLVFALTAFVLLYKLRTEHNMLLERNNIIIEQKKTLETKNKELHDLYLSLKLKQEENLELVKTNAALAVAVTANHELNQPLMIIKGNIEMLQMTLNDELNAKQIKYLRKIDDSVERMTEILRKFKEMESANFENYADSSEEEVIIFDE